MATTSHPWRRFDEPATPARQSVERGPEEDARAWPWVEGSARTLALALLSGSIFGFLLQKGGVAKYDILMGALLLTNFVVFKVMMSAIVVGMVGVLLLERRGLLKTQIVETAYTSNIVGSLIFGLGFGLLAYCPGTDAAAVGQGNYDALVGVAGLLLGSYVYALATRAKPDLASLGARGELTLPEVLRVGRGWVVALASALLILAMVLMELFGP